MKNMIRNMMIAAMFTISSGVCAAAELGRDYTLLNPTQPTQGNKIEVQEFFSYQCPHCYHLHSHLSLWVKKIPKDVVLTYVPVPDFQKSWEPAARAYYALESLGKIKQLDDEIYQAIFAKPASLYDINSFADFVAKHGVSRADFLDACDYTTFTGDIVKKKMDKAREMTLRYRIDGTPTLVVDGKYAIPAHNNPAETIQALKEVIQLARKERGRH